MTLIGTRLSEETRAKMSASHMGNRPSEETRIKRSAALSGEKNPMYGRTGNKSPRYGTHHTDEAREKMSIARGKRITKDETRSKISMALKGKPRSPEIRKKISDGRKGIPMSQEARAKLSASNKGKHPSEETRQKLSNASKGRTHSPETRLKLSIANKGKVLSSEQRAKLASYCGEKASNWRGGISFEPYCPKFNENLKLRVREFFENECLMCGTTENENGKRLSVHHVTYDKMICCDGKPVCFAALCIRCHAKTNGGDRQRWEDMLHRAIDEIWDGKSYFTKEEYAELMK